MHAFPKSNFFINKYHVATSELCCFISESIQQCDPVSGYNNTTISYIHIYKSWLRSDVFNRKH